jgi:hypothetical protein
MTNLLVGSLRFDILLLLPMLPLQVVVVVVVVVAAAMVLLPQLSRKI